MHYSLLASLPEWRNLIEWVVVLSLIIVSTLKENQCVFGFCWRGLHLKVPVNSFIIPALIFAPTESGIVTIVHLVEKRREIKRNVNWTEVRGGAALDSNQHRLDWTRVELHWFSTKQSVATNWTLMNRAELICSLLNCPNKWLQQ